VCLQGGTYRLLQPIWLKRAGRADAWITFRGQRGTALLSVTQPTPGGIFQVQDPAAYILFEGLRFDGGSALAQEAVHVLPQVHHISFVRNTITNMGAGGILVSRADYIMVIGNTIYRFGEGRGWASGVSLNSSGGAWWYDTAPGFHSVIARNVIAGGVDESSYHTDGNGIILDLGGAISPTLIADNVVYMNGGSGILSFGVSGQVYVLNNTLYSDGLDPRVGHAAELGASQAINQVWANNVAYAWTGRATFQTSQSNVIVYSHNAHYGGSGALGITADSLSDPGKIRLTAPLFVGPPKVDPAGTAQWKNAVPPATLGAGLALQARSPLVNSAIDPRTLPGLDSALLAGIQAWAMRDFLGRPRPLGGGFDYGAYER